MTAPARHGVFLGSVCLLVIVLAAGFVLRFRVPKGQLSLVERCEAMGGEWLYRSSDSICIMPSGEWLRYSLGEDAFVNYDRTPKVVAPETGCASQTVAFPSYPVETTFSGRPRVDFATWPAASHYHTAITKDVTRGVNYAGAYVASTWGCGEGCVGLAVINAETGKILEYGLQSPGYTFQPDSRLLQTRAGENYVIEHDVFQQICK